LVKQKYWKILEINIGNIGKYWKILENIGKYWKILESNIENIGKYWNPIFSILGSNIFQYFNIRFQYYLLEFKCDSILILFFLNIC
jgi:hypothetical protein